MLSQVDAVVRHCDVSLNTEPIILAALSDAADDQKVIHEVVLMVELGDLREGLASTDVLEVAQLVVQLPGLTLAGIGTNLACQSGVVPDQRSEEHTSELQSLMRISYAVFCLKKKKKKQHRAHHKHTV